MCGIIPDRTETMLKNTVEEGYVLLSFRKVIHLYEMNVQKVYYRYIDRKYGVLHLPNPDLPLQKYQLLKI